MADHDRDAGSRGEEEAPRDPSSEETPATDSPSERDTDVHPVQQPGLKYGEIPPGPAAGQDYPTTAHTMPGWDSAQQPSRSGSFRQFVRQRPAQLIGAGLIGLALGAVLGGGAVAALSDALDRHDHHGMHGQYRDWAPKRDLVVVPPPCVSEPGEVVVCMDRRDIERIPVPE